MKLSKNLSLAEVTKSITAKRLNIDNTPDELGDAVGFANIETIKAKASTNIAVEIFAASID